MISKTELVEGIRFAGKRAAAAGANAKDWEHQLGHEWTTGAAFSHIAATAPGAANLYPLLDAGVLSGVGAARIARATLPPSTPKGKSKARPGRDRRRPRPDRRLHRHPG